VLSLPVERKISKVKELETIHATAEQQVEMEKRLLIQKHLSRVYRKKIILANY
jgi:hypothetical protein